MKVELTMRIALYLRVSKGEQHSENQRFVLEEALARRGTIVEVYTDEGISGWKGRDKRPAFDQMLKDAGRGKFDLIATWAVDRLGRSLQDLIFFLGDLRACGVDLYVHQQNLDTSTPSGRAMFAMCGVFAELERELIKARVSAGIARARAKGKKFGRPKRDDSIVPKILALRAQGKGMGRIASELGCGSSLVQRVLREAA